MALGAADGRVTIDTELNNKGFVKGVEDLKGQLGGLKSVVGQLGKTIAAAFAVKELIGFGKECVELGSNVAEVQNVVDVAFGDMTDQVEAFAGSAIRNFGMSRLAAKKTASTYMAMAKGMGVADTAAADMAITLAGLTGDVASFYNISQELADTKLKSVFTGETETLKDLGVVMTQDNLKAYALSKGIKKSYDAMTQAEKVAVRYNFVLDSLALANGDFARTSDSWANQTRILSMQWQEFMGIIGQALITVLTPLVKVLNTIVAGLINVANVFNTVISSLFGGANTQVQKTQANAAAVGGAIGESVENQEALTDATKETAKAQEGVLAGFDEINTLSSGSDSVSSGAGAGLGVEDIALDTLSATTKEIEKSELPDFFDKLTDAVAPFKQAFATALSDIAAGASRITSTFKQVWKDIASLASPLKEWFDDEFTAFLNQFIHTIGNTLGGLLDSVGMIFSDLWNIVVFPRLRKWAVDILPAMTEFATQFLATFDVLFDEVKTIFDRIWKEAIAPALKIIQSIWEDAWDSVLNVWDQYGSPVFEKIREAIRNASDYLQNAWETIALPVWETIMAVVDELWSDHIKPLWDNILDFIAMLAEGALDIYNEFIQPVANWFVDIFGPSIADTISTMVEDLGDFLAVVVDVANDIINAFKGVIDFIVGIFTGDWRRAFDGISKILKSAINGMITIVEYFVNGFVKGINKVIEAINRLRIDVPDWVPGFGGETFGFSIQKMQEVKLPRLATGAVVPPNREFLAVLGDNKTETEIVSPLSTMKQAFLEAMQESGGMGGGTIQVKLLLDGRELARNQVKHINNMTRAAGKSILLI